VCVIGFDGSKQAVFESAGANPGICRTAAEVRPRQGTELPAAQRGQFRVSTTTFFPGLLPVPGFQKEPGSCWWTKTSSTSTQLFIVSPGYGRPKKAHFARAC